MQVEEDQDGKPRRILKEFDENEFEVYNRLATTFATDPVHEFIPAFHGMRKHEDEKGRISRHLCIDNLLYDFVNPKIMDVKIGTRTFLESECACPTLRPDLFMKMVKKFPSAPTPEENEAKAVTKHRYLSVHDASSTTTELGYRIEGIAGYRRRKYKEVQEEVLAIAKHEHAKETLLGFIEVTATDDGQITDGPSSSELGTAIRKKLQDFYNVLSASAFVKQHELIGSSVLIVADATGKVGTFWIDFAKTYPASLEITHRNLWELGNHEDGVFLGLENLLVACADVADSLNKAARSVGRRLHRQASIRYCSNHGPVRDAEDVSDVALLSALPTLKGLGDKDTLARLIEELRIGKCTVAKDMISQTVQRSTTIVVLQVQRSDGRILAQLGKRIKDKMFALCRFPGAKLKKGQEVREAVGELIDEKLAPIASMVQLGESKDIVEVKPSVNYGIDTVYLETLWYARLKSDGGEVPPVGRLLELVHQSHSSSDECCLSSWQLPLKTPVYLCAVSSTLDYFFAWLTREEVEECKSAGHQRHLDEWMAALHVEADVVGDLSSAEVRLKKADSGHALLHAALEEDVEESDQTCHSSSALENGVAVMGATSPIMAYVAKPLQNGAVASAHCSTAAFARTRSLTPQPSRSSLRASQQMLVKSRRTLPQLPTLRRSFPVLPTTSSSWFGASGLSTPRRP